MNTSRPICRHCGEKIVSRPRGLCYRCYYTPAVRNMYTSTSKYGRRGIQDCESEPVLPSPTRAWPGSPAKVAVLEERAMAGVCLFSPQDPALFHLPECDRESVKTRGRAARFLLPQ